MDALEIIKFYRSLGLEKRIFLESPPLHRILMQITLGSYLLIALGTMAEDFRAETLNPSVILVFSTLDLIFLWFLIKPNLAPQRLFSFIKYYVILMPIIVIRLLYISEPNWIWYGRLCCVTVNLAILPIFFKYFVRLRTAKKKAIEEKLSEK